MTTFLKSFQAARQASTPLIAVRTPDPAATLSGITAHDPGGAVPIMIWDIVQGLRWHNEAGYDACWTAFLKREGLPVRAKRKEEQARADALRAGAAKELAGKTLNLTEMLDVAKGLPGGSITFISNAHLFLKREDVLQAVWNLRDEFKRDQRSLVLLGPIGFSIPPELANDVLVLDEPLPTLDELGVIIEKQWDGVMEAEAKSDKMDAKLKQKAVDAICGLASFPAEQVVAMSFIKKNGAVTIDTEQLWERKRKTVEMIPGLSVWREPATFDQIGGLDQLKGFLKDIIAGNDPPRIIVFLDEIEKSLAGAIGEGDSSGTTQEMHGTLLSEMENQKYTGLILVGPPGTCKSQMAKATGGEAGIPVVCFDLSAMKSKYVGSSNEQLNASLQVIRAISQGRALFIATCNGIAKLPLALKRRFTLGTYYIDLPTQAEREQIWPIYLKQFGLDPDQKRPDDGGWTGAEIRTCCSNAWRLNRSIIRAAQFLTPVSRIGASEIESLRQQASGNFLSASYEGFYEYHRAAFGPSSTKVRTIQLGEAN